MNTLTSFRDGGDRYSSLRHSLPNTPKRSYNGIHNYDMLKLKMTIDGFSNPKNPRLFSATKSTTLRRYSTPTVHVSSPCPIVANDSFANRYSTLQYYPPEDFTYSFFPSRHKYIKGKKKPIAVKVQQFLEEETMSRRLQQQLKNREQKKRFQNEQKFDKIKERYLQLSKTKKSSLNSTSKPKTAQPKSTKVKASKNEGIIISPWDNEEDAPWF